MRLPDPQRSYAVLIGASAYRSAQLADLPAVRNNLYDLAAVLTDPALGGLPVSRCVVLPDPADARTVYRALRQYAAAAQDTLLVYFAGHGLTGPRNELYLSLTDTEPEELKVSALAFDLIRDVLTDCAADNRVVILDCCFSGRAIQDMGSSDDTFLGQVGVEGTYVLTSAAASAVALAPTGATHTSFTGELLRLLRTGVSGGPDFLTFGEIYRRLLYSTTTRGLPTPKQRGTGTVHLLALTRNPAAIRPSQTIPTGWPQYQEPPEPGQGHQRPGNDRLSPQRQHDQQTMQRRATLRSPKRLRGGNGRRSQRMVFPTATVVVIAAVIAGTLLLNKDHKTLTDASKGGKVTTSVSPSENAHGLEGAKPLIKGWKTVVNAKYGTAFDVPPGWDVDDPDISAGFASDSEPDKPLVLMAAPAWYKEKWCTDGSGKDGDVETTALASTGTKGLQGAKDTESAAQETANSWAYAAYAQNQGVAQDHPATKFTTAWGLEGHWGKSTVTGIAKKRKCDHNGYAMAFVFKNAKGVFTAWVLHSATNVKGEIPDATAKMIMSTVRLTTPSQSSR
ncbi:caspase, EACC1-associated type [Streptomyces sp. WAC 01325]|uniref:caspase family protein n=1 Tax=Streptomyces sp. WAC 01325 TaxID=2203202 RepID=UPI00163CC69C|nr:caspase family protein [Streptomyces sp. WAC 01325]